MSIKLSTNLQFILMELPIVSGMNQILFIFFYILGRRRILQVVYYIGGKHNKFKFCKIYCN